MRSRPIPRLAGLFLFALVLCFATGCGYRSIVAPSARGASDPSDASQVLASRVAVVALRNDSREPWLDRIVGDALRREIATRGRLRLVGDPERADFVLRGRVLPLIQAGSSFSSLVVAAEYRVTLALELEVVRAKGHVVRLSPRALRESDLYLASPDIEATRTNRVEVYRRLSEMIAMRVADSIDGLAEPHPPEPQSEPGS